jgi:hypothetical protein
MGCVANSYITALNTSFDAKNMDPSCPLCKLEFLPDVDKDIRTAIVVPKPKDVPKDNPFIPQISEHYIWMKALFSAYGAEVIGVRVEPEIRDDIVALTTSTQFHDELAVQMFFDEFTEVTEDDENDVANLVQQLMADYVRCEAAQVKHTGYVWEEAWRVMMTYYDTLFTSITKDNVVLNGLVFTPWMAKPAGEARKFFLVPDSEFFEDSEVEPAMKKSSSFTYNFYHPNNYYWYVVEFKKYEIEVRKMETSGLTTFEVTLISRRCLTEAKDVVNNMKDMYNFGDQKDFWDTNDELMLDKIEMILSKNGISLNWIDEHLGNFPNASEAARQKSKDIVELTVKFVDYLIQAMFSDQNPKFLDGAKRLLFPKAPPPATPQKQQELFVPETPERTPEAPRPSTVLLPESPLAPRRTRPRDDSDEDERESNRMRIASHFTFCMRASLEGEVAQDFPPLKS